MDKILSVFKALGEPTRLRIFALCSRGDLTVSELVHILGQSQPRVSRHLKLMCEAGILERLREGSWVFHRLVEKIMDGVDLNTLKGLIPFDDDVIKRDLSRLEDVKIERAQKASDYFRTNASRWAEIRAMHADDHLVEEVLLELLDFKGNEDFLDVGTGTAHLLDVFSSRIKSGWGIDLSSEMLTIARANLEKKNIKNCAVRQGDMYQTPFQGESFDVVSIYQVLHYADEPHQVIAEAKRVLRAKGRLVIVDFAPHEEETLRLQHQHRRLGFSEAEITKICSDMGLRVEQLRHIPGKPLTVSIWLAVKQ